MQKILLAMALSFLPLYGNAAIIEIEAIQVGDNVEFIGSGAIDLTGLGSPDQIGFGLAAVRQDQDFGVIDGARIDRYTITGTFTSFMSFANTSFTLESYSATTTGDAFYISLPQPNLRNRLRLTRGYTSLDALNFTWRALDVQLAELQLNFGTIAEFGNNTIILKGAPTTSVPSPSSGGLLMSVLLGVCFISIRRRQSPTRLAISQQQH